MPSALEILRRDKEAAASYAERASRERVRQLLERSQAELVQRIAQIPASSRDTFTAVHMRQALAQVRAVLSDLTQGLGAAAVDLGLTSAEASASHAIDYIGRAEREYHGSTGALPFHTASMIDSAVRGARASVLRRLASDPSHPGRPGVLARYGLNTIGLFEQVAQQRFIQGKSWAEATNDLVAQSPFLQGKPAFWGERILRTETMHAHNAANQDVMEQVDAVVGEMLKILSATFDARTGSDSIALHGQVRRVHEPFNWWDGAYMHPPNRPNDREVVGPHSMAWPIPAALQPKSDSEVAARWATEGRSGGPPSRPNMSTVDRALIGKPSAAPPMISIDAPPTIEAPPLPTAPESPVPTAPSVEPPPPLPVDLVAQALERRGLEPPAPLPTISEIKDHLLPDYDRVSHASHDAFLAAGQEVMNAVRLYTGSDYDRINQIQRSNGQGLGLSAEDHATAHATIANISKGLKEARARGAIYEGDVYRGLSLNSQEARDALIRNGEWTTPSFTSTSIDPTVALTFTGGSRPTLLRFKQRTGVPLGKTSLFGNGEREVLLDRGIRFRVIREYPLATDPDIHVIELEEVA